MSLNPNRILQTVAGTAMAFAVMAGAQTPATPAPAPRPPLLPQMRPPALYLRSYWSAAVLPPAVFDAGPFGKLSVNGIVTGFSQFQNNHVPGDDSAQATLSNGQIFIQKADGKVQYYIQAGVYTMPTLGIHFFQPRRRFQPFMVLFRSPT